MATRTDFDNKSPPKAVVIGLAVMDTIFRIPKMPESDQSVQVDSFSLHPGGKGLVQAIAAARLGMHVELIAALGDDAFSANIVAYLEGNNVGTNLLKRGSNAPDSPLPLYQNTPVTGVIKYRTGKSIALGWKNETDATIRLTANDIRRADRANALSNADVVFLTFEVPPETVAAAIAVATSAKRRPLIVVIPAPPYEGVPLGREILTKINFLIGQQWEILRLLPETDTAPANLPKKEDLALMLRRDGVEHVCIVDATGTMIQARGELLVIPSFVLNPRDTAGARDAFAVALVDEVIRTDGFSKDAARWAAAAWAAAASVLSEGVPENMPDHDAIRAMLDSVKTEFPSSG